MSTPNPEETVYVSSGRSPRWLTGAVVLLGVGLAGSVLGIINQHSQVVNTKMEVAALRREVATVRTDAGAAESRSRAVFDTLSDELTAARAEARQTADRTRFAARRQAEALVSKVAVRQEEQGKQLTVELDRLKDSTEKASARLTDIGSEVGEVKTEVGGVKTQVASTRTELDKTIAEMHRQNGDMGVMSGLIATNSKEIAALRALGERDYYEFSLGKTQPSRQMAGVSLVYKRADPKRLRYTMTVVADDKRVEKKDRTANEPVQFYVLSKARQPFEVVINEVKKDTIVGYLSVPKTQVAAR